MREIERENKREAAQWGESGDDEDSEDEDSDEDSDDEGSDDEDSEDEDSEDVKGGVGFQFDEMELEEDLEASEPFPRMSVLPIHPPSRPTTYKGPSLGAE